MERIKEIEERLRQCKQLPGNKDEFQAIEAFHNNAEGDVCFLLSEIKRLQEEKREMLNLLVAKGIISTEEFMREALKE